MQTTAQAILVVDDDLDFLRATEAILVSEGYSTLTASSGLKALEKSREYVGHIALLLTGENIPEMDCLTLAEHIITERPNTRVLPMSAVATTVQARFSRLTQPSGIAQLLDQVSKAIARPLPPPALARARKDSTGNCVEAELLAEVNERLRLYLQSSRNFLSATRDVPTGIPNPDGIVRLQQSANSSKLAFEAYRRAQKKLDEHMKGEQGRTEPESER